MACNKSLMMNRFSSEESSGRKIDIGKLSKRIANPLADNRQQVSAERISAYYDSLLIERSLRIPADDESLFQPNPTSFDTASMTSIIEQQADN